MANPNPSPETRFKKGEPVPKGGRPKEARDRITRRYLHALAEDFEKHGVEAIVRLRETDVGKYIQAVGSVVPKEIEINRPLDGLSDEELVAAIQALTGAIRAQAPDLQEAPPPVVTVN